MATNQTEKDLADLHRRTALLDHIYLIPDFCGEQGSISFSDFKRSFERLAGLYGWDDAEKRFVLLTRVSGQAAQLLSIYEKEQKTFDQLCTILENRFSKRVPPEVALQKFLNFKQTANMSVQEFFDRATKLSHSALVVEDGDSEVLEKTRLKMLKAMLISNLTPEIRKGVVARAPKDANDVLRLALLEEQAWESVRVASPSSAVLQFPSQDSQKPAVSQVACAAVQQDIVAKQGEMLIQLTKQVSLLAEKISSLSSEKNKEAPSKTKITCYRCSRIGHYARDCRVRLNSRGNGHGGDSHRYDQREERGDFVQRGGFNGNRGSGNNNRGRNFQNRGGRSGNSDSRYGQGQNNENRQQKEKCNKNEDLN